MKSVKNYYISLMNFLLISVLLLNGLLFTVETYAQNSSPYKSASHVSASNETDRKTKSSLPLTLPLHEGSVRFLAIGDTGRGNKQQNELARVMFNYRQIFPYEFVIMMGDNIYGKEKAEDYKKKFEDVYKSLLDDGVKFYASLGNHDEPGQRFYPHFNMNGARYYRLNKSDVSFYALDTTNMDERQIKWLEDELTKDTSKWKIAFFHHPLYSSGKKHGASEDIRAVLEPLFIKHNVDAVFAGHEHFYERLKPQNGIHYFITGAGGKIRRGNIKENSPLTEKGFDQDLSFMLIEISSDELHFQVVSRLSMIIDSSVIKRHN